DRGETLSRPLRAMNRRNPLSANRFALTPHSPCFPFCFCAPRAYPSPAMDPRDPTREAPMPTFRPVPADVLEKLRAFDTPTVCTAPELVARRPPPRAHPHGRLRASSPKLPPMVGYAATATFRSASPPRAGNVYAGLSEQVAAFAELPGPAVVVFQDID